MYDNSVVEVQFLINTLGLNYLKLSYFLGVTIFIKSDSFLQDGFPLSVKQTSFEILYLILGRFECWSMFVQMQMMIRLGDSVAQPSLCGFTWSQQHSNRYPKAAGGLL